ncbi:WNT2B-like protein [Mya arenaria]|uniref:Protein Wnt n=1 Tax=Mya arenaria TaxID=6604 RepID=A0ABY7FU62_MYAAR|nr:WNT2B-like protein [Mya arenaria]
MYIAYKTPTNKPHLDNQMDTTEWEIILPLHAVGAGVICDNVPGLVGRQRRMCRLHQDAMVILGKGALEGVYECQHQFRKHRWNCSTLHKDSLGHLSTCACDPNKKGRGRDKRGNAFQWGGCSDDVNYGRRFAKTFIDAKERQHMDARAKYNGAIQVMMSQNSGRTDLVVANKHHKEPTQYDLVHSVQRDEYVTAAP